MMLELINKFGEFFNCKKIFFLPSSNNVAYFNIIIT